MLKLDLQGNIQWSQFFKNNELELKDIAINDSSNVFVVGSFSQLLNFQNGSISYNFTGTGITSSFIASFTKNGIIRNSKVLENTGRVNLTNIVCNKTDIIISGHFDSTLYTDNYIFQNNALRSTFIIQYNDSLNTKWMVNLKSSLEVNEYSILAKNGATYIVGAFVDTLFYDSNNANSYLISPGAKVAFIIKYNNLGQPVWTGQPTGIHNSFILDIADNKTDKLHLIGRFNGSINFNVNENPVILNSFSSSYESFILEMDTNGSSNWVIQLNYARYAVAHSIISDSNNIYTVGGFVNSVDFNFNSGQEIRYSYGDADAYLLKMNTNVLTSINSRTPTTTSQNLIVYPMPAESQIEIKNLEFSIHKYEIFDLSGKIIEQSNMNSSDQIDVSRLENGFYLIKVYSKEGKVNSAKFIKRR
jgi:hypothetical protein